MPRLNELLQELSPDQDQELKPVLKNDQPIFTPEGRPVYSDPTGNYVTEKTITVTNPNINDGKPTNIPTVFGGRILTEEESINRIIQSGGKDPITGRELPGYETINYAVEEAKKRSEDLGNQLKGKAKPGTYRLSDLSSELQYTEEQRAKLAGEMTHFGEIPKKERPETRAEKELPELGSGGLMAGENKAKVMEVAPLILMTPNPQEIAKILTTNFKNISITEDEAGNLIANNKKNGAQVVINKRGWSKMDTLQALGLIAAYTPSAKLAGLATTIPKKIATGAAGAAMTETAVQSAQAFMGGDFSVPEIGMAGVFGGLSEMVQPTGKLLKNIVPKKGISPEAEQAVATAQKAVSGLEQQTGIKLDLFKAQQMLEPAELVKQRILPQLSGGSRIAIRELSKQNQQAFDVTSRVLGTIATDQAVETGSRQFRTAAKKAIEIRKAARTARTSKLYDEAFRTHAAQITKGTGVPVETLPVLRQIANRLNTLDPNTRLARELKSLAKEINVNKSDKFQLKKLQTTKFRIDDMLTNNDPKTSLPKEIKNEIAQVQKNLINALSDASPKYAQANREFEKLSPAVNQLYDSLIGKIAYFDDVQLDQITGQVFAPKNLPSTINDMKRIIQEADPAAWDGIVRTELSKRFGGLQAIAETSDDLMQTVNLPLKMKNAIFGSPPQRAKLIASLDGQAKQNMLWLETALERAGQGRAAGSPTIPFKEALEDVRPHGFQAIKDFIFHPTHIAATKGNDLRLKLMFKKNIEALTKVMFDPEWTPQMEKIRTMKEPRAQYKAMLQVLNKALYQEENQ